MMFAGIVVFGSFLFGQAVEHSDGTLNIGFTSGLFVDTNEADGLAATKVWAAAIAKKKMLNIETGSMIFKSIPELEGALKDGKVDLVTLLIKEYLDAEGRLPLTPYFVAEYRGKINEECLLLVHGQSGIDNLEGLAGKEILISNAAWASLGRIWLENALVQRGYSSIDSFFHKSIGTRKPSQAVLPVFFRQVDACLINSEGFNTMVELNPQLRSDLKLIAKSPACAKSVICVRNGYKPHLLKNLLDSLLELHTEPKGQQILTIFKVDRLIPFEESYIQSARQLLLDSNQFMARAKR